MLALPVSSSLFGIMTPSDSMPATMPLLVVIGVVPGTIPTASDESVRLLLPLSMAKLTPLATIMVAAPRETQPHLLALRPIISALSPSAVTSRAPLIAPNAFPPVLLSKPSEFRPLPVPGLQAQAALLMMTDPTKLLLVLKALLLNKALAIGVFRIAFDSIEPSRPRLAIIIVPALARASLLQVSGPRPVSSMLSFRLTVQPPTLPVLRNVPYVVLLVALALRLLAGPLLEKKQLMPRVLASRLEAPNVSPVVVIVVLQPALLFVASAVTTDPVAVILI